MLPLWIIDLRQQSERRDEFKRLVAQIEHVSMPRSDQECDESGDADVSGGEYNDFVSATEMELSGKDMTVKEEVDLDERRKAERDAVISGNYWKYTNVKDFGLSINDCKEDSTVPRTNDGDKGTMLEEPNVDGKKLVQNDSSDETTRETANRLYDFQSYMVKEGQEFIDELRKSNVRPDLKINILVLGDITEEFTRIVFPSVATIIQKEKGRMLPHHIHQGMEVMGMLYIPSDINTRHVEDRVSMQRTLNEIDVQHRLATIRGYDHVMLYQDVQNRTDCHYTKLNEKQLAEYLFQCVLHLYFACNASHPLISGTASSDIFYFSMGAASVFYDTENEDVKGQNRIAAELIRNFKSEGDAEKVNPKLTFIKDDEYNPEDFFIDVTRIESDAQPEMPSPHPVRNFLAKYLKRYYYNLYLRFFTKNLMRHIIEEIDDNTRAQLEQVAANSRRLFTDAKRLIYERISEIIGNLGADDGGLPALTRLFKEMQNQFAERRKSIRDVAEQQFWKSIVQDQVPKELEDSFLSYHDAYQSDLRAKTGTNQKDLKREAVNKLNEIISREATMLSRIGRSVLLGILCALAVVPVLHFLSPHIINIGHIRRFSALWSLALFCVPALCQVISFWRYNRKKKRAVNRLRAICLHDAYARVANRIESEINEFYDKMTNLADRYILRCEDIRTELGKGLEEQQHGKPVFPQTLFNQPLIGGRFGSEKMLPEKEADDCVVSVNYIRYKLRDMGKTEYFLLINNNHNELATLFKDVDICENLIRRVKENGEEELLTMEQQEQEQQEAWEQHLHDFHHRILDLAKEAILPRENATVGEKLWNYYQVTRLRDVLSPLIGFAAANGEFTSSADLEFTDAKINDKRVEYLIRVNDSSVAAKMQIDSYNNVYKKYIFLTRWRCFEHFSFNRILPTEDFDEKIRAQRVFEDEKKSKEQKGKGKKKNRTLTVEQAIEEARQAKDNARIYKPHKSTLLLWALCPDDSSSEWFRLIDAAFFADAYRDKQIYREILNKND